MSWLQEEEDTFKGKGLEDCLRDVLLNHVGTHELWEVDECVHYLFDMSDDEKCGI